MAEGAAPEAHPLQVRVSTERLCESARRDCTSLALRVLRAVPLRRWRRVYQTPRPRPGARGPQRREHTRRGRAHPEGEESEACVAAAVVMSRSSTRTSRS